MPMVIKQVVLLPFCLGIPGSDYPRHLTKVLMRVEYF